jgi:hypothetical protein
VVKKSAKDELVTKEYLEGNFKKSLISDLIKEERILLHKALFESLENAKIYHQNETERYIKVLMDEWRDESRVFHDYMKGIKETQDSHAKRISGLETVIV